MFGLPTLNLNKFKLSASKYLYSFLAITWKNLVSFLLPQFLLTPSYRVWLFHHLLSSHLYMPFPLSSFLSYTLLILCHYILFISLPPIYCWNSLDNQLLLLIVSYCSLLIFVVSLLPIEFRDPLINLFISFGTMFPLLESQYDRFQIAKTVLKDEIKEYS